MNPSVDKRKMPRMQVDVPACIFLGVSNTASDVNIKNLSIHGLSFQSMRYFSQGTSFQLLFPHQNEDLKRKKIKAVVVRCETLNGFSSDNFKIGAKFLFESKFYVEPTKSPFMGENSSALQPFHSKPTPQIIHLRRVVDLPAQPDKGGTQHPPVCTIRIGEIKTEFLQVIQTSRREETIHTILKVKESRFTATNLSTPSPPAFFEEFLEGSASKTFPEIPARENMFAKQFPEPR